MGALVTVRASLLVAASAARWLTMSLVFRVCKHIQQPGESGSFSDWEEMRGGAVWRRAEPPMHACIRMSRKTRRLNPHAPLLSLSWIKPARLQWRRNPPRYAGGEAGRGGGQVNTCNLLLHFSPLYGEDTESPKSPRFLFWMRELRCGAVMTPLHAEREKLLRICWGWHFEPFQTCPSGGETCQGV